MVVTSRDIRHIIQKQKLVLPASQPALLFNHFYIVDEINRSCTVFLFVLENMV
jgi:hypothetical protein